MRTSLSAIVLAAIIVLGGPAMAQAADETYPPDEPTQPTLAGSSAAGVCDRDVPWISYSLTLTDPDQVATDSTARLMLSNGTNSATIPLGSLSGNTLSGRVLWPGASVNGAGVASGWPGWAYENGSWVETSGNFAWTRGPITAVIEVNPSLAVPLSYPVSTPVCTAGPRTAGVAAGGLAVTGVDTPVMIAAGVVGAALLVGGAGILVLRRRRG